MYLPMLLEAHQGATSACCLSQGDVILLRCSRSTPYECLAEAQWKKIIKKKHAFITMLCIYMWLQMVASVLCMLWIFCLACVCVCARLLSVSLHAVTCTCLCDNLYIWLKLFRCLHMFPCVYCVCSGWLLTPNMFSIINSLNTYRYTYIIQIYMG